MKTKARAALLLFGWYLMLAPPNDPGAPLSQWIKAALFDSVQDCLSLASHVSRPYLTMPRCIASDDPSLKEK